MSPRDSIPEQAMEPATARRGITVFVLGEADGAAVEPLRALFEVELRSAGLPAGATLGSSQTALRAAVNAAAADWVLLLREGERVSAALAREIEAATAEPPRAWGFRLRTVPTYGGAVLHLRNGGSEIRLFHRRHVRFDLREQRKEMNVEGAVVRLGAAIEKELWPDSERHREFLRAGGVPHSFLRRTLLFLHGAWRHRALRSAATLRYLWIEAAWDRGGESEARRP